MLRWNEDRADNNGMIRSPVIATPDGTVTTPRCSSPADDRADFIEWQLVVTLYNQTPTLIAGGLALTTVAVVGWIYTHQMWFLLWSVAVAITLLGRLCLDRAFHCRKGPDRTALWRNRFTAGACAMGVLLGVAGFAITNTVDPFVQMIVLLVQMVIVMGGAARNASCVVAARAQVLLGLVPLFFICVVFADRSHLTLSGYVLFDMFAALAIVRHLNTQTVQFLRTDAENRALVAEVRHANDELAGVNLRLAEIATTDALTSIANRRRFDDVLSEEMRRAQRESAELSLLMIDIDAFKAYNDRYGHQAGDDCLRLVAQTLSAALRRPADLAARYGGEEFAAILPQTDTLAAMQLAENIRADVEALLLSGAVGVTSRITLSVGVATQVRERYSRPEHFIRAADAALYAAKDAGRNCVRAAPAPAAEQLDASRA